MNKFKLSHKIARILTEGSFISHSYKENYIYVLKAFNDIDKYKLICKKIGYNPFVLEIQKK